MARSVRTLPGWSRRAEATSQGCDPSKREQEPHGRQAPETLKHPGGRRVEAPARWAVSVRGEGQARRKAGARPRGPRDAARGYEGGLGVGFPRPGTRPEPSVRGARRRSSRRGGWGQRPAFVRFTPPRAPVGALRPLRRIRGAAVGAQTPGRPCVHRAPEGFCMQGCSLHAPPDGRPDHQPFDLTEEHDAARYGRSLREHRGRRARCRERRARHPRSRAVRETRRSDPGIDPRRRRRAGMDTTAAVIVHHELSKYDPGFCLAYLAHSMLFVNNFYFCSNEEQRARRRRSAESGSRGWG